MAEGGPSKGIAGAALSSVVVTFSFDPSLARWYTHEKSAPPVPVNTSSLRQDKKSKTRWRSATWFRVHRRVNKHYRFIPVLVHLVDRPHSGLREATRGGLSVLTMIT